MGPGNTPAIIDESADILLAVNSIIHSKTFDNGMICASEHLLLYLIKYTKRLRKSLRPEAAIS